MLCLADGLYVDTSVIEAVAQTVADRVLRISRSDGASAAATILRHCDVAVESTTLRTLDQLDPDVACRIRRTTFCFDDIAWLTDESVRSLIKNVPMKTLAIAVQGCRQDVMVKLMRNLSDQAQTPSQGRNGLPAVRFAGGNRASTAGHRVDRASHMTASATFAVH